MTPTQSMPISKNGPVIDPRPNGTAFGLIPVTTSFAHRAVLDETGTRVAVEFNDFRVALGIGENGSTVGSAIFQFLLKDGQKAKDIAATISGRCSFQPDFVGVVVLSVGESSRALTMAEFADGAFTLKATEIWAAPRDAGYVPLSLAVVAHHPNLGFPMIDIVRLEIVLDLA